MAAMSMIGARRALAALLAAAFLAAGCGSPAPAPAPPAPPPDPPQAVLAVKVDNVAPARPQTGLDAAGIVYVEPVEAGLTRLLAVFDDPLPAVVGPVRSARLSDIDILAQFGEPVFAFSGAAGHVQRRLDRADLVQATEAGPAYFRDGARQAPHNLYLRPNDLPERGTAPAHHVVARGPVPAGGAPTGAYRVDYPAAAYEFTWDGSRWAVAADGAPMVSAGAGQLGAPTVVVQRVPVSRDAIGSPVARTTGSGEAVVLRDGRAFAGVWSRPGRGDPTRYAATDGTALTAADGPVWVLLVPQG